MRRFLPVFCIFLLCFAVQAWSDSSDSFGTISDYLDGIYGVDDNAGLTAFPVLNVPMGGRSEGMAAAFAAVSDDTSFIEYNPAGSSMLNRSEIAFFHNNWIADTKVEGAIFATRLGNWGFSGGAKWLYLPFTQYNMYGERVSKGYYSEAMAILNTSYNFLESYDFAGISVGVNLKGAFRFVPDYADPNDNLLTGSGSEQSAAMAMADIGALTRFNFLKPYSAHEKNTSVALVVRNVGPPALEDPLPTVLVAALAYKPLRPVQLAFDFYLPMNMDDPTLSEKPYWAAATSVNVVSFLSMHLGVLSKAGGARITVGSAITMQKIALDINYSLDLLTQLQPLNRVSLGVRFDLGDQGRGDLTQQVNELYLSGLDAFSVGKYAEAESYWKEALRISPRFTPATEALKMLAGLEAVGERIDNMQKLDF